MPKTTLITDAAGRCSEKCSLFMYCLDEGFCRIWHNKRNEMPDKECPMRGLLDKKEEYFIIFLKVNTDKSTKRGNKLIMDMKRKVGLDE